MAFVPTLGSGGARCDIELRQGDDLGPYPMTLLDANGVAINLTGATLSGGCRKIGNITGAVIPFTFTNLDLANGSVSFWLPSAVTDNFLAVSFIVSEPSYEWYIKLSDSTAKIQTLPYGLIFMLAKLPT